MKRFFIIFTSLLFLLAVAFPVFAQESSENFRNDEVVTLKQGETINRDFFAFGERVEISGTVNGDVYAAGGNVIVDGTINGDLLAAGGTLNISGKVTQDARVAGGQVTITGDIGKNLSIGGGSVDITDSAKIGGSVLAGAGNLNIASPVGKDIRVGTGSLTISSPIKGNVDAAVGSLRLTSKASVGGNLTYWSDNDASIDSAAKVAGEVAKKTPTQKPPTPNEIFGVATGVILFFKIVSFISTLILGLLIIRLFPSLSQNAADNIKNKPWPSLGLGFIALIATPIIALILAATLVGIPLALIILPIYFMSLYIGRIFVMLWVGTLLSEKTSWKINAYWAFILGVLIYYVVQIIPILGGIVTFLVLLFGLGASLIAKKDAYSSARKDSII
ncbi:MAG: hypothetical protein WD231_00905 [Candidatus Woykebacteria bacterium]